MKKNEEMNNTNRIAIRLKDNSKVYIDRMYIDDKECIVIKMSEGSVIKDANMSEYSVMLFQKMLLDGDSITLRILVEENIAYKEKYFVNNGYLDTHYRSYIPMPEEHIKIREMFLELSSVEEISADLALFKDLMSNKRIVAKTDDLARYDLYYPQIKVLKKKLAKKD